MTRTLILMRHAKSSWDDLSLDDHERVLNQRGRDSAAALGDWLRDNGHLPDEIICSSAARTQETCARLKLDAPVTQSDRLYHADPLVMLDLMRRATGQTVLLIGHNPGIASFAAQILTRPPEHARFFDYPTGATLVAQFDVPDWIGARTGEVVDFTVPRDLIG